MPGEVESDRPSLGTGPGRDRSARQIGGADCRSGPEERNGPDRAGSRQIGADRVGSDPGQTGPDWIGSGSDGIGPDGSDESDGSDQVDSDQIRVESGWGQGGARGAGDGGVRCVCMERVGDLAMPHANPIFPPPHLTWEDTGVVAHIDLDCFFAQVVELDNPEVRGKPVIVGGGPRSDGSFGRGVVCTANYAARAKGVRTAMPSAQAARLCPDAVFMHAGFGRYSEVSGEVMEVCRDFTPDVNVVGIDEAYLTLTGLDRWAAQFEGDTTVTPTRPTNAHEAADETPASTVAQTATSPQSPIPSPSFPSDWPVTIARRLQQAILERTAMHVSIGIGPNHFVAKIASGYVKPQGITVVRPSIAADFIATLPLRKLRGVGPVTEQRLRARGYTHAKHIVHADPEQVHNDLGDFGLDLWRKAHAHPIPSRMAGEHARRSISRERTFGEDVTDREELRRTLQHLTSRAAFTLRQKGLAAGCVSIKLRYADFTTLTRDRSLKDDAAGQIGCSDQDADILPVAEALLDRLLNDNRRRQAVRLLGVKLSALTTDGQRQLRLGETEDYERRASLYDTADAIRKRHGFDAITTLGAMRKKKS